MRFDGNRSLRNLKFYFEIEIFSEYKVSVLVGGLTPPSWVQIFLRDGNFSKWVSLKKTHQYLQNEWLNHTSGTIETKLSPISEKQCV